MFSPTLGMRINENENTVAYTVWEYSSIYQLMRERVRNLQNPLSSQDNIYMLSWKEPIEIHIRTQSIFHLCI